MLWFNNFRWSWSFLMNLKSIIIKLLSTTSLVYIKNLIQRFKRRCKHNKELRLTIMACFGRPLLSAFLVFFKFVIVDFFAVPTEPDKVVPRSVFPLGISTNYQFGVLFITEFVLVNRSSESDEAGVSPKSYETSRSLRNRAVIVFFVSL